MSNENDQVTNTTSPSFEGTPEKAAATRKLARYSDKADEILERVRRKEASKTPKHSKDNIVSSSSDRTDSACSIFTIHDSIGGSICDVSGCSRRMLRY